MLIISMPASVGYAVKDDEVAVECGDSSPLSFSFRWKSADDADWK